MFYPSLERKAVRKKVTSVFRGLDMRLRGADGAFTDMENLSDGCYPMLGVRKKRSVSAHLSAPGGLIEKDALAWVDGGTLYYNGLPTPVTHLAPGEKRLVSMGAYICIFPDKVFYNTADPADYGSMEASWSYTGRVSYTLCSAQGEDYDGVTESEYEPDAPEAGALWLDTGERALCRWDAASEQWISIESVYTKLTFTTQGQLPGKFSLYDGVSVTGAHFEGLNGSKIIYGIGGGENESDYIILVSEPVSPGYFDGESITIKRSVPETDYVCQCRNRLWGCRYGNDGAGNINELYACALGDFKNWNQFMGLSTDSWRASVGSDGVWTGAVNYLGTPIFFKENCLHRISVSAAGAHQVDETVCRGVEKGSEKSLAVVNETLLYKSRSDICAYQGGFPESISAALGGRRYSHAAAGVLGQKYYVSMLDEKNAPSLFVYDMAHGLWFREDGLRAECFAKVDDELFCIADNRLIALTGSAGETEKTVKWYAESGALGLEYTGEKYISRLILRALLGCGSVLELFTEYDSSGVWEFAGRVHRHSLGSIEIPLRVRRCDHMRIKLAGEGEMKLVSLTLELTEG